MASIHEAPAGLKVIQPYLRAAQEHDNREPIVSLTKYLKKNYFYEQSFNCFLCQKYWFSGRNRSSNR
jgi:hypothetical protein